MDGCFIIKMHIFLTIVNTVFYYLITAITKNKICQYKTIVFDNYNKINNYNVFIGIERFLFLVILTLVYLIIIKPLSYMIGRDRDYTFGILSV